MQRFVDVDLDSVLSSSSSHQLGVKVVAKSTEFDKHKRNSNYLKGVKWSPDGTCILTTSADKIARVFVL